MSTRLPSVDGGTHARPRADAVRGFQEFVGSMFDTDFPDPDRHPIELRSRFFLMGQSMLARAQVAGGQFEYRRDARKIAAGRVDHICVYLHLEGSDHLQADGAGGIAEPGDISLLDMTRPVVRTNTGNNIQNLILPRSLFGQTERRLDGLHGMILPKGGVANTLLGAHLHTLWSAAPEAFLEDGPVLIKATVGLICGLLLSGPAPADEAQSLTQARVLRIRRHIKRHLADPGLDADSLCRRLGLSRASLYRHMAPFGGVSNYIRTQRLQQVYLALSDPEHRHRSAIEVARAWGFVDASGFFRAFKKRYAINPADLRTNVGMITDPLGAKPTGAVHLPSWLNDDD